MFISRGAFENVARGLFYRAIVGWALPTVSKVGSAHPTMAQKPPFLRGERGIYPEFCKRSIIQLDTQDFPSVFKFNFGTITRHYF
jgi:hypothetical protein